MTQAGRRAVRDATADSGHLEVRTDEQDRRSRIAGAGSLRAPFAGTTCLLRSTPPSACSNSTDATSSARSAMRSAGASRATDRSATRGMSGRPAAPPAITLSRLTAPKLRSAFCPLDPTGTVSRPAKPVLRVQNPNRSDHGKRISLNQQGVRHRVSLEAPRLHVRCRLGLASQLQRLGVGF